MKLFSFSSFLLIFSLLTSSRTEDADNSDYGSGNDIDDYAGSGDYTDVGQSPETPRLPNEDDDRTNFIEEGETYVGRGDNEEEDTNNGIDFGGDQIHPGAEVKPRESTEEDRGEFSIRHPAVLALIIGGIIFVLLIVLLLIMFVVYRLRKKDEGSYALDENMKKKSRNIIYTKPPIQDEFFA